MFPNELPTLVSVLDNVKHIEGAHLWHLLIDELHVEDVMTVSREARVVGQGSVMGPLPSAAPRLIFPWLVLPVGSVWGQGSGVCVVMGWAFGDDLAVSWARACVEGLLHRGGDIVQR